MHVHICIKLIPLCYPPETNTGMINQLSLHKKKSFFLKNKDKRKNKKNILLSIKYQMYLKKMKQKQKQ